VFPYLLLGVALLIALILLGRWFATADPKAMVKGLKVAGLGLVVLVVVYLTVTGRLFWALAALPALVPWLVRMRAVARLFKNLGRMGGGMTAAGGSGTGQTSSVRTRFLAMSLDHDTGAMDGEVLEGRQTGRRLGELSLDELLDLLAVCATADPPSAKVLEAYLDRVHGEAWRSRAQEAAEAETGETGGARASTSPVMTRDEAFHVLGLEPGASEEEIKEAYRRLMARLHPDHGGSDYLAAKLNQARDLLLSGG
jgi:hypothetical protein